MHQLNFKHPVIAELYKHDFDIPEQLLEEIIALPRQSLISDLELIIKDSIVNFDYYEDEEEESLLEFNYFYVVIHAVHILTHIDSQASLHVLLDILRQSDEYMEFWFDENFVEFLWYPIGYLGRNKLHTLKEFGLDRSIEFYYRSVVHIALARISIFDDQKYNQISEVLRETLNNYLEEYFATGKTEEEFNLILIEEASEHGDYKLMPLIKHFIDNGIIDRDVCLSLEEISNKMNELEVSFPNFYADNMYDWYEYYRQTTFLHTLNKDYNNVFFYPGEYNQQMLKDLKIPYMNPQKKTQRNDPCPCGSGKLFKNCCGMISLN